METKALRNLIMGGAMKTRSSTLPQLEGLTVEAGRVTMTDLTTTVTARLDACGLDGLAEGRYSIEAVKLVKKGLVVQPNEIGDFDLGTAWDTFRGAGKTGSKKLSPLPAEWWEAGRAVLPAASKDITRTVLTRPWYSHAQRAMVATDGRRMHIQRGLKCLKVWDQMPVGVTVSPLADWVCAKIGDDGQGMRSGNSFYWESLDGGLSLAMKLDGGMRTNWVQVVPDLTDAACFSLPGEMLDKARLLDAKAFEYVQYDSDRNGVGGWHAKHDKDEFKVGLGDWPEASGAFEFAGFTLGYLLDAVGFAGGGEFLVASSSWDTITGIDWEGAWRMPWLTGPVVFRKGNRDAVLMPTHQDKTVQADRVARIRAKLAAEAA